MAASKGSIDMSVSLLVGLGDFIEAAKLVAGSYTKSDWGESSRRDAMKGVTRAALGAGDLASALEILAAHGQDLDNDLIVAINDRIVNERPDLQEALIAVMKKFDDGSTGSHKAVPEPIVIDDLPAAARQFED